MVRLAVRGFGFLFRAVFAFHRETGRSLAFWVLLAALNFAVQIVFRRQLVPGEFATLNTLLAVVALMAVPVLALEQAFLHFQPRPPAPERAAVLQEARLPLTQGFAAVWAPLSVVLFFLVLQGLNLPRFSLVPVTLASGLIALGAAFSAAYYRAQNRWWLWSVLLFIAAVARLLLALGWTAPEPWAEAGLAAGMLAGFILLAPLVRRVGIRFQWKTLRAAWRDREFALYLAATLSVALGLFLFTNADRIVAQAGFGRPEDNNLGYVPWGIFDAYQTAGLLGRALLWGTQPLLLVLLARRGRLDRTPAGVRQLFWVYVGALAIGAFLLHGLAQPLSRLFGGGSDAATASFISGFALAMLPMGLLQGLGIFALASRRYPECFTLGASGLVYALVLYFVGRPQLMLSYVFGGGLVALFLVLFVGVVRWGRKQP